MAIILFTISLIAVFLVKKKNANLGGHANYNYRCPYTTSRATKKILYAGRVPVRKTSKK